MMTASERPSRLLVEHVLSLLDRAFAGEEWHSLLSNLRTTMPADWEWLPADGLRSIRQIVQHVGGCKLMYDNYAFGDGTLRWDDPLVAGGAQTGDLPSAVTWLHDGHARLRESITALTDDELARPRMTPWGAAKTTLWIITTLIEHDVYHAGEINHLRSLHDGDDRWAHERLPE